MDFLRYYFTVWIMSHLCSVTAFYEDAVFWIVDRDKVFVVNETSKWTAGSGTFSSFSFAFAGQKTLVASSFHHDKDYLVFSEPGTKSIFIYEPGRKRASYAHVGVSNRVGEVAVDWINFNVYWADSIYGWISVQALPEDLTISKFNANKKTVISKSLDKPYGLALSPIKRFLFWTDFGIQPRLERSSLLGTERKILVWSGLIKPISVTADHVTERLFWIDESRATIETCDYEGGSRKVLLQRLGFTLNSVAVLQDHLFYSEQKSKQVYVVSKVTGKNAARSVVSSLVPYGISVFSKSLQPPASSPCKTKGCEQICVNTNEGAVCQCETGKSVSRNGMTCNGGLKAIGKSIIYSDGSKISAIPVTSINSHQYVKLDVTFLARADNITFLAHSVGHNTVYYSSGNKVVEKAMFNDTERILVTAKGHITGLTFDWKQEEIVWTEKNSGAISATSRVSFETRLVFSDQDSPSALAVDAHGGRLFWISHGTTFKIMTRNSTGDRGSITTLVGSDLLQPMRLAYDMRSDRIYWSDDGIIGSIKADKREKRVFSRPSIPTFMGVGMFRDYILWTEASQRKVNLHALLDDVAGKWSTQFTIPDVETVTDIQVYDIGGWGFGELDACERDNGDCEQFCLPTDEYRVCACAFGFSLQKDGTSCKTDKLKTDFVLAIDDLHRKMYQINRVTGTVSGIGILAGSYPSHVTYESQRKQILWYDKPTQLIKRANLDGSKETVVTYIGTENSEVKDIASDPSTGNVFYTVAYNGSSGAIKVVTKDGRNKKTILLSKEVPGPLAIYPKTGVLIWGAGNQIKMADLSGASVSVLVSQGTSEVTDMAIDEKGEILYWTDQRGDKIQSLHLKTRLRKTIRESSGEFPSAIDVKGDILFYLTKAGRSIKTMNRLTETEGKSLSEAAEFGHLGDIYVDKNSILSVNKECADTNGRCSTFCLPTFSGRVCACADKVFLTPDQRRCEGVELCPAKIPNGAFSSECTFYFDSTCQFVCAKAYAPTTDTSGHVVKCQGDRTWSTSPDVLCKPISGEDGGVPLAVLLPAVIGGVVILIIIISVLLICLRIKKRRTGGLHGVQDLSIIPNIVISKQKEEEEVYDTIDPPTMETERYTAFNRISPCVPRKGVEAKDSAIYLTASHSNEIGFDLRVPLAAPRPPESLTPRTRQRESCLSEPDIDYDDPMKGEYLDLDDKPKVQKF